MILQINFEVDLLTLLWEAIHLIATEKYFILGNGITFKSDSINFLQKPNNIRSTGLYDKNITNLIYGLPSRLVCLC